MRIPRLGKTLLAAVLAVVGAVVITGAASADSGQVGFKAQGPVIFVGLDIPNESYTTASMEFDRKDRIRSIAIQTYGEAVQAAVAEAQCRPRNSSWCTDLQGTALLSVHYSQATLTSVELIPNPWPGASGSAASGRLKGSLGGVFAVTKGIETIAGGATLEIRGSATYACLVPGEGLFGLVGVDITECDGAIPGTAFMIPVVLDVKDHGTFALGPGTLGSTTILGAEGHVRVDVSSALLLSQLEGTIRITEARVQLP